MGISEIIQQIGELNFYVRLSIVFIVTMFMPLSAMTFFFYMLDKKEQDFHKAVRDMGISSSRKVRDTYRGVHFFLPVAFATFICFLAISFITFSGNILLTPEGFPRPTRSILLQGVTFGTGNEVTQTLYSAVAVTFAFAGAYIWSSINIIRRLTNYDLSPNNYYTAGVRILLACTVSILLALFQGETFGVGLAVIGFLAGMFPERIVTWFVDRYKDFIGGDRILDRQMDLENIEGISVSHKERLTEIGIDNAQNLAATSLLDLLIRTPFSTRELLDWMGQAKLLLYVKDNIYPLRELGIRSVFDFFKGYKTKEKMQEIAEIRGIDPAMMGLVYEQVTNDEGIKALYEFERNMNLPNEKGEFPSPPRYSQQHKKAAIATQAATTDTDDYTD